MIAIFFDDDKSIIVREYVEENFLDPVDAVLVRETRYDVTAISDSSAKITNAYYVAMVLVKEFESEDKKKYNPSPQILVFYGGDASLWDVFDMEWQIYKHRKDLYIIPAYYGADEVENFVKTAFYEFNVHRCL